MIIDYDRRPNATEAERLQSLIDNMHLALNEKASVTDLNLIKNDIADIKKTMNKIIELVQQ